MNIWAESYRFTCYIEDFHLVYVQNKFFHPKYFHADVQEAEHLRFARIAPDLSSLYCFSFSALRPLYTSMNK